MKSPYYRVGLLLRNFGSFCTNSKHQKYQMALAAAGAIRYILSLPMKQNNMWNQLNFNGKKLIQDSKESPLPDNIIKHLQCNPQIRPETVIKFKEMFDPTNGVELPTHLLTQSRIRDGRNSNGRFSFFPNRIVTIPIFNIINHIDKKTLVHGNAGISKTVSFVYYSYLAQLITQYELEFNESIAKDIPRLLYFSYQTTSGQSELQQHISNLLKSHFPQKLKPKQNFQNKSDIFVYYKILLRDNKIQAKSIVDQFNSYSARCRGFNDGIDKLMIKSQLTEELRAQKKWLLFQKNLWFEATRRLAQNRVIFNSSQNFEQSVVGRAEEPKISFDINHHSDANNFNINFFDNNRSVDTHRQIVYLLFFELLRMSNNEKVEKAKPTFLKVANSRIFENQSLITPYQIRKFLEAKKNEILKEIGQMNFNNEKKIMEWVTDKVKKILQINLQYAKNSAKKFLEEGTQQIKREKLFMLMDVRRILENRLEKIGQKKLASKIQLQIFDLLKKEQVDDEWFDVTPSIHNVDKNLFEVTLMNNGSEKISQIKLKYSASNYLHITEFIEQKILDILSKVDEKAFQDLIKHLTNGSKGQFLDTLIVKILRLYPTNFEFYDQRKQKTVHFKLQPAKKFQHFNQKKNIPFLKTRFSQMLVDKQIICGRPVTIQQEQSTVSTRIDFIIIQNLDNGIIVNSFDLTIRDSVNDKLTNSYLKIKKILNDQYNNKNISQHLKIIEWNHVILCQKKNFSFYDKKTLDKKNYQTKINCYTSPIDTINIQRNLNNISTKRAQQIISKSKKDYNLYQQLRQDLFPPIKKR